MQPQSCCSYTGGNSLALLAGQRRPLSNEHCSRLARHSFGQVVLKLLMLYPSTLSSLVYETLQAGLLSVYTLPHGMQVEFAVHVYQLSEEGPADADAEDAEEGISSYQEYELPAREFHGLWDSLIFVGDIKQRLVSYASTALHFSDCKVNSQLVSFNRTALLHGPAGTGKTSM